MTLEAPSQNEPIFVLFSGKRKSGKDFCSARLVELLTARGIKVESEGVSVGLKRIYAFKFGLDFEELLTDGPYKEQFRKKMIDWGEEVRSKNPGAFCQTVAQTAHKSSADVFIVPDCRRPTDYQYFCSNVKKKITVRIFASEEIRKSRGWTFVEGIDDAESECALDNWPNYDFTIENSRNRLEEQLEKIVHWILQQLN